MRFTSRFAPATTGLTLGPRDIERGDSVVTVSAPEGWSDVRIEAWLDWLDALPEGEGRPRPDPEAAEEDAPKSASNFNTSESDLRGALNNDSISDEERKQISL